MKPYCSYFNPIETISLLTGNKILSKNIYQSAITKTLRICSNDSHGYHTSIGKLVGGKPKMLFHFIWLDVKCKYFG